MYLLGNVNNIEEITYRRININQINIKAEYFV